jgi:hypothetical protein
MEKQPKYNTSVSKDKRSKYSLRKRFGSTKKDAKEEKQENDKFLQAIADVEMNLKNIETNKPKTNQDSIIKKKEERLYKSKIRKKKAISKLDHGKKSKREIKSKKEIKANLEKEPVRTQGYNFYKRNEKTIFCNF